MRTVRRLIYKSVATQTALVGAAFAALAFFIDFVDESQDLGQNGLTLPLVMRACLLLQIRHAYELMPIALLIGSILAMARMAQTSEFTILRTGGLGPLRALKTLAGVGVFAAVAVAFLGDACVPWAEQVLNQQHVRFSKQNQMNLGRGGSWLRERQHQPGTPDSEQHIITVNVGSAISDGEFRDVRIFEFDPKGHLIRRISARRAHLRPAAKFLAIGEVDAAAPSEVAAKDEGSLWALEDVSDTHWQAHDMLPQSAALTGLPVAQEQHWTNLNWRSSLTPTVVSAAVLPPESMSALALWRYSRHLSTNAQAAQRYEVQFWKKSVYPLVCMVMVALALPFAYLHARSSGMSIKIFMGIMVGISYVLLNHISSHLGTLQNWQPWLAAAAPSMFYLLLSMTVFAWLVRYQ